MGISEIPKRSLVHESKDLGAADGLVNFSSVEQLVAANENAAVEHSTVLSSLPDFPQIQRRVLRIGLGIMLTTLAIEWVVIALQRPEPLPIQRGEAFHNQFRVEINDATWVEWMQLKDIGISLAHRIVSYRKLNGAFKTIDDVGRVPGIGPSTLDRIRPWLTIRHELSETPSIDAAQTFDARSSSDAK